LHYDKVLKEQKNSELLALIERFYGPGIKLAVILEKKPEEKIKELKTVAETALADQAMKEQALRKQAEEHPLVKKALEIFGGDITKVELLDRHEMN